MCRSEQVPGAHAELPEHVPGTHVVPEARPSRTCPNMYLAPMPSTHAELPEHVPGTHTALPEHVPGTHAAPESRPLVLDLRRLVPGGLGSIAGETLRVLLSN